MPSLAQRLRDEGKEIGLIEGKDLGIKEGKDLGLKEGKDLGLNEGKEQGIKEVARKMLIEKFPIETIINLTGLPKETILVLQI